MGITKKVLKIIGRLLLGILAVFLAFLIIVKIWNEIAMSHEKELLEDHPGEFVEIDGRNMPKNGEICCQYFREYNIEIPIFVTKGE